MANFDDFAKGYEKRLNNRLKNMAGGSLNFFIKTKCDEMSAYLKDEGVASSDSVFLDIGCGTGIAERYLDEKTKAVIGLDSSVKMLQAAQNNSKTRSRFACGTVLKLPFEDESFDVVFSFCLFHHLSKEEMAAACEEMRRVTRIGGYILGFEHNPLNLFTQYVVKACEVDRDTILITGNRMKRLFGGVGLVVKKTKYILFLPKKLRFLAAIENYLGWLPLGGQYFVAGQRIR